MKDWKKGEVEAVPGRTMPNLKVVTRDYADTFRMMTALGPLVRQPGIGVKGISWQAEEEYEELKRRNGAVAEAGISRQMPDLTTARQAAEAILVLSPETNGSTAVKAWRAMEQKTGLHLTHLSAAEEGEKYTFERLINTPGSTISGKRGGTHNSVTRILMKPTQMIGGYAQLSYAFNYYGPTGAQRDEVIEVRKAREVQWYED
ncbi:hypothetical protein K1V27_09015 [Syntrophobacteraceae bacterium DRH4]|nr:hypothetical protein [Desulfoferrobacter suflitae]MCK8601835.1 hypothetical protein [Desulfoferrobacter suflitae]